MYRIKTSDLLSGKDIAEELTSIEVVKNISDDLCETKQHYLMAAFSSGYKIEFSFDKENNICQYIMVEEFNKKREKQNINIEFVKNAVGILTLCKLSVFLPELVFCLACSL